MACVQTLVGARPITERADVEEGFAALYRDQYRPMVRVAFLMTSDNAVAEELVQDAFVRVYRKFDRVENPAAYLRRAVTNACRSHHRRRFLEKAHEPERTLPAGPPEIDVMWEQLQQLTPKRRMALVLRFYEDLKIDEIAEVMDCSPGTVKSPPRAGVVAQGGGDMTELLEQRVRETCRLKAATVECSDDAYARIMGRVRRPRWWELSWARAAAAGLAAGVAIATLGPAVVDTLPPGPDVLFTEPGREAVAPAPQPTSADEGPRVFSEPAPGVDVDELTWTRVADAEVLAAGEFTEMSDISRTAAGFVAVGSTSDPALSPAGTRGAFWRSPAGSGSVWTAASTRAGSLRSWRCIRSGRRGSWRWGTPTTPRSPPFPSPGSRRTAQRSRPSSCRAAASCAL
ncbi:hypothetical protein BH23ACT8_BH23ACT8_14450 [soil metagenome]